jgi:hypothetical protein
MHTAKYVKYKSSASEFDDKTLEVMTVFLVYEIFQAQV